MTQRCRPERSLERAIVAGASLAVLLAACAASESDTVSPPESQPPEIGSGADKCVPGHQTSCACPGGSEGVQSCLGDASGLGPCDCGNSAATPASSGSSAQPTGPCGDGVCADDENCHTCTPDCGTCAPCDVAPKCDNAMVPKPGLPHAPEYDVPKMEWVPAAALAEKLAVAVAQTGDAVRVLAAALDATAARNEHPFVGALRAVLDMHPQEKSALARQLSLAGMGDPALYRADFPERRVDHDEPTMLYGDVAPPGGTMECGAPLLRIAVARVVVHEEDDDWANDIVYCVLQAEAATGAEVRVTPKTPNLDEGQSHQFALESGVFWGQKEPRTPGGNMLITYDCIEADTSDGYQKLVNAIGQSANQIGDVVQGDNGWIFKTAGAIAPIVSTGLALDSDDHLFNAQQTIPLDKQLALTNGAYWTVRRAGTHAWSDWDWELEVKAWGCAEYGEL